MLRVEQHLICNCEHVPPVVVELLLAPVLPLLQQRPPLGRDTPHEMGSGLARVTSERGVGGGGRGEGAAGMLAAVGERHEVLLSRG